MTEAQGSTATPEHSSSDGHGSDDVPRKGRGSASDDGKKSGRQKQAKKNVFARLATFYRQVIAELRKVVWPTRNELTTYTTVVIVFCVIIIAIVYGLDYGFSKATFAIFG